MNAGAPLTQFLLRAYGVVGQTGIFRMRWARRAFTGAYFLYKHFVEDPYADLVSAHPELFKGGSILDVGANIGYTATLFATAADPQAQVYAFEPDPENFAALLDLTKRRTFHGRIVPVCAAVGERDGEVKLWRNRASHADHRIWTKEFSASVSPGDADVIAVPLISLDSFLAGRNIDPCFVKIDVQGYELPVCLGLLQTMETRRDLKVAFEYDPVMIAGHGFDPRALLDLFWSRGFFVYVIQPRGRLQALPREEAGFVNPLEGHYWELLASREEFLPAAEL